MTTQPRADRGCDPLEIESSLPRKTNHADRKPSGVHSAQLTFSDTCRTPPAGALSEGPTSTKGEMRTIQVNPRARREEMATIVFFQPAHAIVLSKQW